MCVCVCCVCVQGYFWHTNTWARTLTHVLSDVNGNVRASSLALSHSRLLWRWPTCPLSPTPPPLVGLRAGRIVLTHTLPPFFFLPAASLAVTSCASGKHFVCCSDWPCVTYCGLTQGAQSGGMPLIKQKSAAAAAAQLSFFLWLKLCRHKTITKATTLVTIVVLMMISDLDYLSVASYQP